MYFTRKKMDENLSGRTLVLWMRVMRMCFTFFSVQPIFLGPKRNTIYECGLLRIPFGQIEVSEHRETPRNIEEKGVVPSRQCNVPFKSCHSQKMDGTALWSAPVSSLFTLSGTFGFPSVPKLKTFVYRHKFVYNEEAI